MTRCSGLAGARTFPKTASCNGLDSEAPRLCACSQDKGPRLDILQITCAAAWILF